MKQFLAAFILLITVSINAQFTTNTQILRNDAGITVSWAGQLDTLGGTYDSIWTTRFELEDFDASNYLTVYHDFTATNDSPNVCVDLYASEDGTTFSFFKQIIDTTESVAPTWTATTLDYARPKYLKLLIEQVAGGRDNTTFAIKVRFPAKDAKIRSE